MHSHNTSTHIPSYAASDLVPIGNASFGSLPILLWFLHKHHNFPETVTS